jgi:hypothetical protein
MLRHTSRLPVSRLASRLLAGAAVGVLVAGLVSGPVSAGEATPSEPASPASGGGSPQLVGPQTAGTPGCAVPNNLDEITGIAMTPAGLAVIEGGARQDPPIVEIVTLDPSTCQGDSEVWYDTNPRNPQDLHFINGTLYICDCGDVELNRQSVALEKVVPNGAGWEIYRFAFPNGPLNAKAMLVDSTGLPIFLAPEAGGVTGIFTAPQLPQQNNQEPLALVRAGQWEPVQTGTPNPQGPVGETVVTGAAMSPDGTRVVIRTYSDAYEYEVTGGNLVAAITGEPIGVTPLPNEPQGEAITYSADGTQFITLSTRPDGSSTAPQLLTYDRWIAPPPAPVTEEPTAPVDEGGGFLGRFSMSELTKIVAAVGVVGLVLAIAGIIGIRRARRRRMEDDEYDDYDDDDDDYDDEDDDDYDDRRSRRSRRGRGRDDYAPREPAYTGAGYDDGYGDQDYGGYQQGYAGPGYGEPGYAGDQGYGGAGYQQGYGGQGYGDQGYADPAYTDPAYADPSYGAQPGYGDYGAQPGYGDYGGQPGYDDYGRRPGY